MTDQEREIQERQIQEREIINTPPIDSALLEAAVWRNGTEKRRSDFDLDPSARAEMPGTRCLRPAAVLCAVTPRPQGLHVILTRRAAHLKKHAGQIAFPGGKVELTDRSPRATALREAEEEIGLTQDLVDVIGPLEKYETGTGFLVTPFVGLTAPAYKPLVDHNEVAEVFEVPLDFLMDPNNFQRVSRVISGHQRPFFAVPWRDYYIWGATAAILKSLSERLQNARLTVSPQSMIKINQPWLHDDDVRSVMNALIAQGATARFVGGCVRSAIVQETASDLDVAIDVIPDETVRLLERAGLKAIPTGIDHGTITTVTPRSHTPIEITSLRKDVETDGRRAVVAFTKDWREDAARRDFTMNALYADIDGRIFDPLGGFEDAQRRCVRFIGRAADRIKEDALRILRFFRFVAQHGAYNAHTKEDIADIQSLAPLLRNLARERIGQEMRKLLCTDSPLVALELMQSIGVLAITFQDLEEPNLSFFGALRAQELALVVKPSFLRRLALISDAPSKDLADAFRLSNSEVRQLDGIRAALVMTAAEAGYRHGRDIARDSILIAAARSDFADPAAALKAAAHGARQRLPITAQDLLSLGLPPGPELGTRLKLMERAWIDSGFAIGKIDLLESGCR